MTSNDDWASLVEAALALANFTGGIVTIAMPGGATWVASADAQGATFGSGGYDGPGRVATLHAIPGDKP